MSLFKCRSNSTDSDLGSVRRHFKLYHSIVKEVNKARDILTMNVLLY